MKVLSRVSNFCHFMMILSNYTKLLRILSFYGIIITSLPLDFCIFLKSHVQKYFGQNFFKFVIDFQIFAAHFAKK